MPAGTPWARPAVQPVPQRASSQPRGPRPVPRLALGGSMPDRLAPFCKKRADSCSGGIRRNMAAQRGSSSGAPAPSGALASSGVPAPPGTPSAPHPPLAAGRRSAALSRVRWSLFTHRDHFAVRNVTKYSLWECAKYTGDAGAVALPPLWRRGEVGGACGIAMEAASQFRFANAEAGYFPPFSEESIPRLRGN